MSVEVVSVQSSFSFLLYLLVFLLMGIVFAIIFLVKKLNYRFWEIMRLAGVCLLVSVFVDLVLVVLSFFLSQPMCDVGGYCPSNAELLLPLLYYVTQIVFLVVFLGCLVVKFVRNRYLCLS